MEGLGHRTTARWRPRHRNHREKVAALPLAKLPVVYEEKAGSKNVLKARMVRGRDDDMQ